MNRESYTLRTISKIMKKDFLGALPRYRGKAPIFPGQSAFSVEKLEIRRRCLNQSSYDILSFFLDNFWAFKMVFQYTGTNEIGLITHKMMKILPKIGIFKKGILGIWY